MENQCPMNGCDGSGHINGSFSTHRSLSGCPYSIRFSELQQQNEIKSCPVPGCDGLGNTKSIYSYHRSIQRCPMIRQQLEKYNLSISQMEEMLKKKPNMFLEPGGPKIPIDKPGENNHNNNKKIAKASTNWNGSKPITNVNHPRNGQTRREIKMAKNRTNNQMSPSKMASLKRKTRVPIPIEWNKAQKSNGNVKNKAFSMKFEYSSDDETNGTAKDAIKLQVLNCDIQSMDLVKEHREHLSIKYQEMEQLFDELQEEEREWSQKITQQQKDIDNMVHTITDMKQVTENVLQILGDMCGEIHPMSQTLPIQTKSNNHLSFLEEIIENRHKKEFNRLFKIIKKDPRLARLENLICLKTSS